MLRLCLLLLIGAFYYGNSVEDNGIREQETRSDVGERASVKNLRKLAVERNDFQNLEDLLALKDILGQVASLSKRQADDGYDRTPDDNIAMTSDEIKKIESDDVFGDDGSEPLKEVFEHIYQEWQDLIMLGDADGIVNKYTEDCIHIYHKNGKTRILNGRNNIKDAYEEWFNQEGVHSLKVEPLKEGRLGTEFLYLLDHIKLFNEFKNQIGAVTDLVIFKHIKHDDCEGGYQVYLVSEVHD